MKDNNIKEILMNQKLARLYEEMLEKWAPVWSEHNGKQVDTDERWGDFLTNPYLLSPSINYESAVHSGMFCYQETYSYGSELGEKDAMFIKGLASADKLMDLHREKMNTQQQRTTIWNFSRAIERETGGIQYLYNNLIKIGLCGRRGFVREMQPHILKREIEITKPSFLIFLIGNNPKYLRELVANDIIIHSHKPLFSKDGKTYVEEWETNLNIPVLWSFHPTYLCFKSVNRDVQAIMIKWINDLSKED